LRESRTRLNSDFSFSKGMYIAKWLIELAKLNQPHNLINLI
jgi:hypothetical protein